MQTMQSLARELYNALETKTRPNGDDFLCLKENSPQWMADVIYAAHGRGEYLPDDWRYKFTQDACSAIIEHEDDRDAGRDSLEPSIYTGQLLQWLASNLNRPEYCDIANREWGADTDGIVRTISRGQLYEMYETFDLVYDALEALVNDQEEAA